MCTDKDTRHPIEMLAPEGPHEIISIPAEQAAPMADLAAFTEQLSLFTREDYYGDAPYPHTPLTYQADKRLWERVKKAINVYGKTPHCFRHTFATRAHRAGVDDKTLQSMGSWKDLSTMKNIYIHTQQEDLETARQQLTAV